MNMLIQSNYQTKTHKLSLEHNASLTQKQACTDKPPSVKKNHLQDAPTQPARNQNWKTL